VGVPTERLAQPQIQRWVLPTDWLDYLGLAISVGERVYIEMAYEEGEEKDYHRLMNTFFLVVDLLFATLPGAGGGGVAMRSSRQFAVAGWDAIPISVRTEIIEEVARRMGWSTTRVIQALHLMMMSNNNGEGGDTDHESDRDGTSESHGERNANPQDEPNLTAGHQRPQPGVGGNGTTSEFGDLSGMIRSEVDDFLRSRGSSDPTTTAGGYTRYRFPDSSEVHIRPNGEVVRLPARRYGPDGRRINRGARLDQNGRLTESHNTGEMVID
ncbi:MAG: hypothetical protein F6K30_21740, partial [Cyanothece sp. SIO2G6]|nr:hypothetical protein [Cyanothece sp. SIO2G6]